MWPAIALAPALVLLLLWTYLPLAQAVELSTLRWNLLPTTTPEAAGLANYERAFASSATGGALLRTIATIGGLCVFTTVLPTVLCFALQRVNERAGRALRALFFVPYVMAPVAVAAIWKWILDPRGPLNTLLGTDVNWIHERATALPAILIITGWHVLGFATVIVWAGLRQIADGYERAAAVDGATVAQTRRWVTLPLLSPTLVFLVLMTVLLGPQWTFPMIDTTTQGGPVGATTHLHYLLWELGFTSFDAGFGAAVGVLLFAGSAVVASVLTWVGSRVTFRAS